MKKLLLILLISIGSTAFALDLMSEDYPPYNYPDENGKPTGISVDIVKEIIKATGDSDNIKILPWARSYREIQNKPNKVLFVMTRTPAREFLFKWVGPVANNTWVLFAKKDSDIKVSSLEQVKNLNYRVGTYLDDACDIYLREQGFINLHTVPNDQLNVKKLIKGRIDLWIVGEGQGIFKARRENNAHKKIKKVLDIKTTKLYIAFSKTTPNSVINQWQAELDKLKANGKYQEIMNKYLK